LTPLFKFSRFKSVKQYLHVLQAQGVTKVERKISLKPVQEFKGPVLDYRCNCICDQCHKQIRNGQVPENALANRLWLGAVPSKLSSLNFVEQLLVAHVHLNSCFVHVAASGLGKMTSHVITFESPILKVY
jgi:hypothetical protein